MPLMATKPVEFSRRGFLSALGGLVALPVFSGSGLGASLLSSSDAPLFASAFKKSAGGYGIAVLDDLGQIQAEISLPGRGHGIAVSDTGDCLAAFARRPGTFAIVAWPFSGKPMQTIVAAPGRHFYGHGCFSKDGRILFAVENDFASARGVVGVYDVSGETITRLGEFDSHGIGPHEILLSPDGNALIVANGGIETHPDHGRQKLNLETMSPSVVFLDVKTGDLLAEHRLDRSLHQLSLRHMALDRAGRAWVGGQFEGLKTDTPPLVAVISRDEAPVLLDLPGKLVGRLENYIGSVTATTDQSVIATSAPRGGRTLFWNTETRDYLGHQNIADGCGVAPIDQGSFLISDGNGGVSYLSDPGERAEILARPAGFAWDNHMTAFRI
ncbi:DUF1513 domain-containing protein [Labrenzia sp. R4_1]|uniref:DUF1513 domain-containing protein n=1 Tax=Labrenzia sp. R4_1 TaxID=2821106 RepID=UPI001ADD27C5|nr:DUF1513 domain-containing protein [Labrenzia sp. R4_1]MBO9427348.1 DUF1513 domain-containing protein [Labrenzia sp. R4_1]